MAGTLTIEALAPLKVRFQSDGSRYDLQAGQRATLPEIHALKLLVGAKDKVRLVPSDTVTIESANTNMRAVYFMRNDGRIHGPGTVTDLAKTGTGIKEVFWVIVAFEGQLAWVHSDRLRSRQAFEQQNKPTAFERVRAPK